MNFLPEEDQEYLQNKGLSYELKVEKVPDGTECRGIFFPGFILPTRLKYRKDAALDVCETCDLLIIIPSGYATTKLDSFYTIPFFKRQDGSDVQNANTTATFFQKGWQFWSRHLLDSEWRVGHDGLDTYLNYIRNELRIA